MLLTLLSFKASKNHKHAINNPYSQFRNGWSKEDVLKSTKVTNQLTKFMCSPTSVNFFFSYRLCTPPDEALGYQDGAACCIVASETFVHAHKLVNQAIEIVAQALTTDGPSTFEGRSAMDVVGYSMTKNCADQVFNSVGFKEGEGRDLVGVIELHDCFAANEVSQFRDC